MKLNHKIIAFIILSVFFSCSKDNSQTKTFQRDKLSDNCDSAKIRNLVKTILNTGQIYGYSENAKLRNFEIVEANSLINEGEEFKTNFDFNIKTIDSSDMEETGGTLRFINIEFSNDSSVVHIETKYYGDNMRPLNNTILELNFNSLNCEWTVAKSEFSVF